MKRLPVILACLILAGILIAACGGAPAPQQPVKPAPTVQPTAAPKTVEPELEKIYEDEPFSLEVFCSESKVTLISDIDGITVGGVQFRGQDKVLGVGDELIRSFECKPGQKATLAFGKIMGWSTKETRNYVSIQRYDVPQSR